MSMKFLERRGYKIFLKKCQNEDLRNKRCRSGVFPLEWRVCMGYAHDFSAKEWQLFNLTTGVEALAGRMDKLFKSHS